MSVVPPRDKRKDELKEKEKQLAEKDEQIDNLTRALKNSRNNSSSIPIHSETYQPTYPAYENTPSYGRPGAFDVTGESQKDPVYRTNKQRLRRRERVALTFSGLVGGYIGFEIGALVTNNIIGALYSGFVGVILTGALPFWILKDRRRRSYQ